MTASSAFFDSPLATSPSTQTINQLSRAWDRSQDQISSGVDPSLAELVLRPPFQRQSVWSRHQQAFLVDSILRGFPVPEIYIQRRSDADGGESMVVVDGQQRVTACLEFIGGSYAIPDRDEFHSRWRGKYFGDLDDDLRSRFREFRFITRELDSKLNDDGMREVFRRLNTTVVSLNAAELRNAEFTNEFTRMIRKACDAAVLSELSVFSGNDIRRMKNEEFIAEVADVIVGAGYPNKKEGLPDLYVAMDGEGEERQQRVSDISKRLGRALRALDPITSSLRRTRFTNKSDFYSLLSYLSLNAERVSPGRDAMQIGQALVDFSRRVSRVRELRNSQEDLFGHDHDDLAERYLSAVERAASDRLNRVRRHRILEDILGFEASVEVDELTEIDDVRNWRPEDDFDEAAAADEDRMVGEAAGS